MNHRGRGNSLLNLSELAKLVRGGIARLLIGYLNLGIKKIVCRNRVCLIHYRHIHLAAIERHGRRIGAFGKLFRQIAIQLSNRIAVLGKLVAIDNQVKLGRSIFHAVFDFGIALHLANDPHHIFADTHQLILIGTLDPQRKPTAGHRAHRLGRRSVGNHFAVQARSTLLQLIQNRKHLAFGGH